MRRSPFPTLLWSLAMATIFCLTGSAYARDWAAELMDVLIDVPSEALPSGILYDRVVPLSRIERFGGEAESPPATPGAWRQIYDEIWRASLDAPTWPSLEQVLQRAGEQVERGMIPIAVMDFRFERIRSDALERGNLVMCQGRLGLETGEAFVTRRVFSAAALRDYTHQGESVTFHLATQNYLTRTGTIPRVVEIDFDNGHGFVNVALDQPHRIRYATPGPKTIHLRAVTESEVLEARFLFRVRALRTPAPHDTLHIQANIPFQGAYGSGDAYVYLSDQHTTLTEPVVIIEGFDLDNSMNWDELYELLNREEFLETLRTRGFDPVVLNFDDAVDFVQKNGFVAIELIEQVQAAIDPEKSIVVAGASMGGLVGRYALAYMEAYAYDHRVRSFISFDGPQAGADIPLGLQYWIWFFADLSPDAAAFLAALDSPAARQQLIYHYTDPPAATGESDPLRGELEADLAALGDYPQEPRRVGMANGSGAQAGQGFDPGDQIIEWVYESALLDIIGNVWAVPDGESHLIFHGLIDPFLLPADEVNVTVSGTGPLDNAPGGWRASMTQLDTTAAPFGDIVALHPHHCFIPSISALDLDTGDLFYDIVNDPELLSHTPFDAVYFPLQNQEHVDINPEIVAWLIAEIEMGATSHTDDVPSGPPVASLYFPSPHLTGEDVRISFTAPRAGPARLAVFDAGGREIVRLAERHIAAGNGHVLWNGRDGEGRRPGRGVYFVQMRGDGYASSRKLVIP